MKKLSLYEPAMCCETGLCGVSVNPELLRISTTIATLKKKGFQIQRYNMSNAPRAFVQNTSVNTLLKNQGMNVLPITVLDGSIVLTGRYPTDGELTAWLNLSKDTFETTAHTGQPANACDCKGGC